METSLQVRALRADSKGRIVSILFVPAGMEGVFTHYEEFQKNVASHTARVRVRACDYVFEGDVHLPNKAPGIPARVSDFLNQDCPFIALTNVLATSAAGPQDPPRQYKVVLLSKGHIDFVVPLD